MFLPGIFSIPTTDRDEALYAQATKQMVQTNDYSKVKFQNRARHLKPPGIYWLQALSVKSFSSPDSTAMWPYRMVSTIGATIAVLGTFFLFADALGLAVAGLGAAFLAVSLLTSIEVHIANTDSMLLACMVLMQGGLWRAYREVQSNERISKSAFFLFWVAMAGGVLIKGITPLVGFLTLFGLCWFDKSWQIWRFLKPLKGIGLFIVLTLLWLVPVSIAGHSNFLWDMISGDVLPKLTSGQQSHGAWPGYYLMLLPLLLMPASLMLPEIYKFVLTHFSLHSNEPRNERTIKLFVRFSVSWVLFTWIVFALIPTKLPQYIWPLFPALGLLAALSLLTGVRYYSGKRHVVQCYQIVWLLYIFALAVLLVIYPHRLNGVYSLQSILAGSTLFFLALLVWAFHRMGKIKTTAALMILMSMLSLPVVFCQVLPKLKSMWLSEKVLVRLQSTGAIKNITAKNPLLATGYTEPSLVFLVGTKKVKMVGLKALAHDLKVHQYGLLLQKQWREFGTFAKSAKVDIKTISKAYGFRYNGGHWQTIVIVERTA